MLHSFFIILIIVTCFFLITKALRVLVCWLRLLHVLDSLVKLYVPFKEAYNNNDFSSNTKIVYIKRFGLYAPMHIPIEKDLISLFPFMICESYDCIIKIKSEIGILYSFIYKHLFKKKIELLDKISSEARLIMLEQDGIDRVKKFWGWCPKTTIRIENI